MCDPISDQSVDVSVISLSDEVLDVRSENWVISMRFGLSSFSTSKLPETAQTLSVSLETHYSRAMAAEVPNTLIALGFDSEIAVKLADAQGAVIVTYTIIGKEQTEGKVV